jgi:uncharacterized protein YqgC (DUF456 family)
MFIIVLFVVAAAWFVANNKYVSTGTWKYRRMRAAYAWAFIGAIIGSSFGVAGMGSAIAGTIPGAIVGYLIASNLMKKDVDPTQKE